MHEQESASPRKIRKQQNATLSEPVLWCISIAMAQKVADKTEHRNIREQLVRELLDRIATSTAPWEQPWDPIQGDGSPVNAVTNKNYRGVNYWWLSLLQPGTDPRWCTFKQAKDQGWSVRKGEHGVPIEKWGTTSETKKDGGEIHATGDAKVEKPHLFVRYYTAFHASQIEGIPELESPDPAPLFVERDQRLVDVLDKMGVPLSHKGARAYYVPGQDRIVLPARGSFVSVTDYNMTLLHEMAHATGHPTRLNRSLKNSFGSEAYAKEELRASIGSSMNARILGIALDPGALHEGERDEIENEAAYIKSWLSALPEAERKAELLAAITAAQKISDYVLGLALPQQEDEAQVVAVDTT